VHWKITIYSGRVEAEIHGTPHTRPMGDGLFELRLKAAEGIARVFFCTVVARKIVVLHQFLKKSEKTPNRELKIARSRMKEIRDD
jgi:phage-related protein